MAAAWIHQIELSKLVFKAGFSGVAPKIASYRIGYVSNTLRSNFDRILIEIESKSNRIAKRMYSGKVICACFLKGYRQNFARERSQAFVNSKSAS
jgi:p-aminobenzoyl-glutamate transporter AbgT